MCKPLIIIMGPQAPINDRAADAGGTGVSPPGKFLNFKVEIKPSPAVSGNVTYKYWVVN